MTGELRVKITMTPSADLPDGVQIVGNIYPVDRDGTSFRDVLFPAGEEAVPARFTVPAGRYLIEAMLPNSEILSDEAEVAEGQVDMVTLTVDQAPNEWHSWQYLVGNVMPADSYSTSRPLVPRSSRSWYLNRSRLESGPRPAASGPIIRFPPPYSSLISIERVPAVSYAELAELARRKRRIAAEEVSKTVQAPFPAPMPPLRDDAITQLFRLGGEDPAPADPARRQFLMVESAEESYMVTLPTPWSDVHGNQSAIEVLVNLAKSPTGSPIGVTVRDRVIGAGLAYMAAGALAEAFAVFQDARDTLPREPVNPFSLTAGAYVCLGTESGREQRDWDDWIEILRSRFPQYSDGSVLWASRRLRTARSEHEVELARKGLIEACELGLPIFTLGLSWLMDGLSRFPEDAGCATWLDRVRQVSWLADMRQPFIVLRFATPL
jgi:hypothetical protein